MPDGLFTQPWAAFDITRVKVSDGISTLGANTFASMLYLEEVELGKNVKKIGTEAFYNDTVLKKINFPDGLTSVGDFRPVVLRCGFVHGPGCRFLPVLRSEGQVGTFSHDRVRLARLPRFLSRSVRVFVRFRCPEYPGDVLPVVFPQHGEVIEQQDGER